MSPVQPRSSKPTLRAHCHLGIDARVLHPHKRHTGFYTYLSELLRALHQHNNLRQPANRRPAYHFTLYSCEPLAKELLQSLKVTAKYFSFQHIPPPPHAESECGNWRFFRTLAQRLSTAANKPDILLFPQQSKLPLSLRAFSRAGIRTVLTVHDLIPSIFLLPQNILSGKTPLKTLSSEGLSLALTMKLSYRHWNAILCVSPTARTQLHQLLGRQVQPASSAAAPHITITPLGAAEEFKTCSSQTFVKLAPTLQANRFFPPSLKPAAQPPPKPPTNPLRFKQYILYFSGHSIRKNVARGVHACLQVINEHKSSLSLVVIGDGKWTNALSKLPNAHKLCFLHPLNRTQLALLVAAARFTLHPSLMEGFGLPVIESIRAGTLCIASKIPTNIDLLGDDYPLFNPYKLQDIKRTVQHFIAFSPQQNKQLLRQAQSQARRFSWTHCAQTTHAALQKAMSTTP